MSEQKRETSERPRQWPRLVAGAVTVASLAIMITVDHMPARMFAVVTAIGAWAGELVFSEPARNKNAERERRRDLLRREHLRKERERLAEYESTRR